MQNLHDALIKNSMKLSEIRVKFLLNLENNFNNVTEKISTQNNYNGKNKTYDRCTNSALKRIFKIYSHIRNETRQVFNSKINEIEDILSLEFQMSNKQLLKFHPEMKKCTGEENRGTLSCIFYQTSVAKSNIKETIEDINDVNSLGNELSKQLEDSNVEHLKEFYHSSSIITDGIELCLKEKKSSGNRH
ncbi:hypothetical protein HCN44_005694 [Aphidius gifuensis]|uniref:Uncharacterized protein n=2 Tax=Aphidius gifuensis TaxID=684658 RepID=A0A835CT50_APHGI|nr:hypothetical protein HCN44_005694 [Aphidius gifuensis]